MQEIKQSIINKIQLKSWFIAKVKWHYQVLKDAKSGKKSDEVF